VDYFLQQVVNGLQLGFVYALIALGYTMVYGIVRLINFAHGDVFMVGAFVSFFAVTRFNLHQWPAAVFPAIPPMIGIIIGSITVIILSMLICVMLAVTIERVAYKPLRDAPRIAALITAIGTGVGEDEFKLDEARYQELVERVEQVVEATGLLAVRGLGSGTAVALRLLTGAALACVYPPGIKIAAGWTDRNRGAAIGICRIASMLWRAAST